MRDLTRRVRDIGLEVMLCILIALATLFLATAAHAGRGACVVCEGTEEIELEAGCYDEDPFTGEHMGTAICQQTYGGQFFPEEFCVDDDVWDAWEACQVIPPLGCCVVNGENQGSTTEAFCDEARGVWSEEEVCTEAVPTMPVASYGLLFLVLSGALMVAYRRVTG